MMRHVLMNEVIGQYENMPHTDYDYLMRQMHYSV